jgi:hypothetical protein
MDFQIDETFILKEFDRLAEDLLFKSILIVNSERFNFTEIEFYYYNRDHQDAFTHEHSLPAGKWRFHNQGFDITLRGKTGFGGILIRGVKGKEYVNGPRRVLFEVMSHLNPVSVINNNIGIQEVNEKKGQLFKTFRHGLGKSDPKLECDDIEYFRNAPYRYLVNPKNFNKSQFSGAEKIARGFKDPKLAFEFLGYHLKID